MTREQKKRNRNIFLIAVILWAVVVALTIIAHAN